jgi:hypothetical protein
VAFGGGVNLRRARPRHCELLNKREHLGNNGASAAHQRHLNWALSGDTTHMQPFIAVAVRAALRAEADRRSGGGETRLNLTDLANPLHHLQATRCTVEVNDFPKRGELIL